MILFYSGEIIQLLYSSFFNLNLSRSSLRCIIIITNCDLNFKFLPNVDGTSASTVYWEILFFSVGEHVWLRGNWSLVCMSLCVCQDLSWKLSPLWFVTVFTAVVSNQNFADHFFCQFVFRRATKQYNNDSVLLSVKLKPIAYQKPTTQTVDTGRRK